MIGSESKIFMFMGSILAAMGVVLGAFGAHALKTRLPSDLMAVYQTAVQYHLIHALGLFAVACASVYLDSRVLVRWSGWTMFVGIVIFSGSLYALSMSGVRGFGAVTPVGGLAFILAWLLLAVAVWRG